jgi:hypothetical protein
MDNEQRVIIKFLTNQSVDPHKIHARLSAEFGQQTYALRAIQFWVRETQPGRENLHDEHRSGKSALDYIRTKTISIFEKTLFESAHSLAQSGTWIMQPCCIVRTKNWDSNPTIFDGHRTC